MIHVQAGINGTDIDDVTDFAERISDFAEGDTSGAKIDLGGESYILLDGVEASVLMADLDGYFDII